MEPKKNLKSDVSRNSSLFFAVGLTIMLVVANYAINYKTYDKSDIDIGRLNMEEELEEEIPVTEQLQTTPPPPPPPAPEVIEIFEDEEEIEETVIESTETNQERRLSLRISKLRKLKKMLKFHLWSSKMFLFFLVVNQEVMTPNESVCLTRSANS